MPTTMQFSAKAKTQIAAEIAKENFTPKSATVPAKKAKALAQLDAKAANEKWERPNFNALCRKLAGGDVIAGLLLAHVLYVWRNRRNKLQRHGKDWLAHTRDRWAFAAGLSRHEMTSRALPRLRNYCFEFLTIKAMGNGTGKKLWIHVDEIALREHVSGSEAMPWEFFDITLNSVGPGTEKGPADAYQKH